jgi:hypothetical protein
MVAYRIRISSSCRRLRLVLGEDLPQLRGPMALRLACSGSEAVDLEAAGDPDDAGLIFAGGEVAGLFGGSWAGPVGPVADEEGRVEDLEQEGGDGQVKILRGESPP